MAGTEFQSIYLSTDIATQEELDKVDSGAVHLSGDETLSGDLWLKKVDLIDNPLCGYAAYWIDYADLEPYAFRSDSGLAVQFMNWMHSGIPMDQWQLSYFTVWSGNDTPLAAQHPISSAILVPENENIGTDDGWRGDWDYADWEGSINLMYGAMAFYFSLHVTGEGGPGQQHISSLWAGQEALKTYELWEGNAYEAGTMTADNGQVVEYNVFIPGGGWSLRSIDGAHHITAHTINDIAEFEFQCDMENQYWENVLSTKFTLSSDIEPIQLEIEEISGKAGQIEASVGSLAAWKRDFGQVSAKTVPGAYTQVNIANDLGTSISGIVIGSAAASGKNTPQANVLIGTNNALGNVSSWTNVEIGTANSISKSRSESYGDTTHVILGYHNYTDESEFGRNSVIMGGCSNSFKIEPDTREPAFANWKNEYIALGEHFGARQLSGQYRTTTIDIGTNPSKLSASANHILIGTVGQNDTASHRRIGDQCIGITLRDASISSHYDNVQYNSSFEPRTFGDKCITIGVNAQGWMDNSIAIGYQARSGDSLVGDNPNTIEPDAIAIGHSSWATKTDSIGIGHMARAVTSSAIQIGRGRNTTLSSFQVFDYQMLDGNGDIPTARLSASLSSYVPKNVDSVTIGTNASTYSQGIAIGRLAKNTGDSAIAIGRQSEAFSNSSIAIGSEAKVATGAVGAVQIGYSATANNVEKSLRFRDWQIIDGNGDIPSARLSSVLSGYVRKDFLKETLSSKISAIDSFDGTQVTQDYISVLVDALSSVMTLL